MPFDPFRPHPWHGLAAGPEPPGLVHAYIEITPFDGVKYEIDKETGYLRVDRPQRTSSLPPSLYGFVPRTYCGARVAALMPGAAVGDCDPLDVCVVSERPISRAEVILSARVVGGLPMLDGGEADDKIIAVLENDEVFSAARDVGDLPSALVERLRHYFHTYKVLPGEELSVRIGPTYGREHALQVVRAAMEDYEDLRGAERPEMRGGEPMSDIGLYEAMSTLRAVRRLRPDPVPDDVLERVLRAATWAPSGGNVQPWRVVVVQDPAKKKRLQELYIGPWRAYEEGHRGGIEHLEGEARAKQERMIASATHLAEHLHEAPAILIFCFEPGRMAITDAKLDRISVVGGGSIYPAVQNALLACRAEGLGCTLTTLLCFAEAEVKELLGIPDPWYTCAAVPIGYPASKGHGPITRRDPSRMAYRDSWGDPFTVG